MPITALSHITFVVRDIERTAKLWQEGLGAVEVYDSLLKSYSLSREKFFMLGPVWVAVMEGEPSNRSYRHVAFQTSQEELPVFEHRLRALGVEIKPPRQRVEGRASPCTSMTTMTTFWSCTAARWKVV